MIIIKLAGGLGNQMFQYAFAYAISQKYKTQLKLDISAFNYDKLRRYELDCFNILPQIATTEDICRFKYKNENILKKVFRKLTQQPQKFSETYVKEPIIDLNSDIFIKQDDFYFDGYWQSQKYFQDYRCNMINIFTLKDKLHIKSQTFQQQILNSQSISIHIRRGDYVTNAKTNSVHGTCSIDYYHQAVTHITSRIKNPHYFIFSDDLTWTKDNLLINQPMTFIELDHTGSDCEELILMSQCKHNIIANSSFSWWGAWLNQNPNKVVIAPQHWFRDASIKTEDLIPEPWLLI